MNERPEILKVHPLFHKKVKIDAAMRGQSILEYTKSLAQDEAVDEANNKKKEKYGFKFKSF